SWSETNAPDTAGCARVRACRVTGENAPQTRGRCERTFLRYDGNNYAAGVPPASFCVVGSQGPPFSVTQLISRPPQLPTYCTRKGPPRQRLSAHPDIAQNGVNLRSRKF